MDWQAQRDPQDKNYIDSFLRIAQSETTSFLIEQGQKKNFYTQGSKNSKPFKNIYILKEYKILYKLIQNSEQIYESIFLGAQLLLFSIFLKNMLLEPDRMSHHYSFYSAFGLILCNLTFFDVILPVLRFKLFDTSIHDIKTNLYAFCSSTLPFPTGIVENDLSQSYDLDQIQILDLNFSDFDLGRHNNYLEHKK
ncbi:hypothetical protein BpHYR1_012159 [Brachionus plicatilis]|uniref:Transmembrane protein n=1 Tax=Brachionus plicatilis TaxID=10195 RepID=A0A3M7SD50_BRAPC|nr:hypothetical protein BpHYR1_012159 [Brachionus plicatilis]